LGAECCAWLKSFCFKSRGIFTSVLIDCLSYLDEPALVCGST
jgi:hypothetical protein